MRPKLRKNEEKIFLKTFPPKKFFSDKKNKKQAIFILLITFLVGYIKKKNKKARKF